MSSAITSIQLEIQRLFNIDPNTNKRCSSYSPHDQHFCTTPLNQRAQAEMWSITRHLARKTRLSPRPSLRAHGNELPRTLHQLATYALCSRHSSRENIRMLTFQWLAIAELHDRVFPLRPDYRRRLRNPQHVLALILAQSIPYQQIQRTALARLPQAEADMWRAGLLALDNLPDARFASFACELNDVLADVLVESEDS